MSSAQVMEIKTDRMIGRQMSSRTSAKQKNTRTQRNRKKKTWSKMQTEAPRQKLQNAPNPQFFPAETNPLVI